MSKKLNIKQIQKRAKKFILCKNSNEIENLLKLNRFSLIQAAVNSEYYYFSIPKPHGGVRKIEAPADWLKKIQAKINKYLQYIYYCNQADAAYGFIISAKKQNPKDIVSNAAEHLGNSYLINIDFDDFFHQINKKDVYNIFRKHPFNMNKKLAKTLTKICINKGHLPMGAPTSPVLSNFACMDMDKEMQNWSVNNNIKYTRFVDDLSFSSKEKITEKHFAQIKQITDKYNFNLEKTKTKWFGKEEDKIVTGLLIADKIKIPDEYYKELDKDIDRLQKNIELQIITGNIYKSGATKKYKQEIKGKINFIATVTGYDSLLYNKYTDKYETALNPPDKDKLSMRWMKFSNYTNF